jgi:hypothetical protein
MFCLHVIEDAQSSLDEALEELGVARFPRALVLIETAPQPIEEVQHRDKQDAGGRHRRVHQQPWRE